MSGKSEGSTITYRVGECMQELLKSWKDFQSSQDGKTEEGLQSGPTLEIRIPAEHVTATNRQVSFADFSICVRRATILPRAKILAIGDKIPDTYIYISIHMYHTYSLCSCAVRRKTLNPAYILLKLVDVCACVHIAICLALWLYLFFITPFILK